MSTRTEVSPRDRKQHDKSVDLTKPAAPSSSDAPSMPHERDEGAGMTGGVASKRVQQGHRDVQRGVQDTSRAPEADQAYKRQKS